MKRVLAGWLTMALLAAACSGSEAGSDTTTTTVATTTTTTTPATTTTAVATTTTAVPQPILEPRAVWLRFEGGTEFGTFAVLVCGEADTTADVTLTITGPAGDHVATIPVTTPSPRADEETCSTIHDPAASFDGLGLDVGATVDVSAVVHDPVLDEAGWPRLEETVTVTRTLTIPPGTTLYPGEYDLCRIRGFDWVGEESLYRGHDYCEWAAVDLPTSDPLEVMFVSGERRAVGPIELADRVAWSLLESEVCLASVSAYLGVPTPAASSYRTAYITYGPNDSMFDGHLIDRIAEDFYTSRPPWGRTLAGVCDFPHEFVHVALDRTPFPGWLNEGVATYLESEVRGVTHYDLDVTCTDTTWAATIPIAGEPVAVEERPYPDLSERVASSDPGVYSYYAGSCFWVLFEERFGHDAFQQVMQALVAERDETSKRGCTARVSFVNDILAPVVGDAGADLAALFAIGADHSRCPFELATDG